jgi:hypothetical protein
VFYFILAFCALGASQTQPQPQAQPQKFPIMTWPGPDKSLLTLETFQKIAEAGFSLNMSFYGERDINLKALDLAQQAGIQLLVQDARVAKLVEDASLPLTSLDPIIAVYKDHPAFWGYFILDEPNAAKFDRIAEIFAYLKDKDPGHPAYVNLFPTYATPQQLGTETYEQHVQSFLEKVKPTFLSYDHYPITSTSLREDYYLNLEIIRGMAEKFGLPFWAFTLVTAHAVYPPPTAAHIRLQLFSDLAYGAKGLQYFTYGTPTGSDFEWKYGLIDPQGKPTLAYEFASEINQQVRQVAPLVAGWKSEAVYHSDPVPKGCRPLASDGLVQKVQSCPMVIGIFNLAGDTYVMFVNRDYESDRMAMIRFALKVKRLIEVVKDSSVPTQIGWSLDEKEKTSALKFRAGDARIFKVIF